jgi:hypothetical protein
MPVSAAKQAKNTFTGKSVANLGTAKVTSDQKLGGQSAFNWTLTGFQSVEGLQPSAASLRRFINRQRDVAEIALWTH